LSALVTSPAVADKESRARLSAVVEYVLGEAKKYGASAAEAGVNISQGLSLTVRRLGEVETVEHTRDKGMGVTVYFGQRTASASTTDFSETALRETVRAACTIARYTAEDDCAGLADPERLAKDIPDLDLHHPWNPGTERAIELARAAESAARGLDKRITNSEGGSLSTHEGLEVYGNTHGFLGAVAATRHSLSVSVIAQDDSGMQRDYWYTVARAAAGLESPEKVGLKRAPACGAWEAETFRANARYYMKRRSPRSVIASCQRCARFQPVPPGLVPAGCIGKPVFADFVRIHEQPHLKARRSAAFDERGVATKPRDLVRDGILQGYVLDSIPRASSRCRPPAMPAACTISPSNTARTIWSR
jgi:PmbA protein